MSQYILVSVRITLVSVGITLVSVGITVNDIWFNAHDINGLLGQLKVSAKVTVLWNTGEWDYPIVGIPQCFNNINVHTYIFR